MLAAAQRQQKLAAKMARRKAVVAEKRAIEASSSSLAGRIRVAAKGSVVQCLMSSTLFETGMGYVVLARALPSGLVGCAYFLIDSLCLGVKDAFYAETSRTELHSRLAMMSEVQDLVDIAPAHARKLIRDAAAYAAGLGLFAAKDTPVIEAIFGDVDAAACTETFTFGRDGTPFFIPGPNDSPARIRFVNQMISKSHPDSVWDIRVEALPELAYAED